MIPRSLNPLAIKRQIDEQVEEYKHFLTADVKKRFQPQIEPLAQKSMALHDLKEKINTQLVGAVNNLSSAEALYSRQVTPLDPTSTVAAPTANPYTTIGQYTVQITTLATASTYVGAGGIASTLVSTDVTATSTETGPFLSGLGFAQLLTPGTFTINGQSVTLSLTNTVQQLFQAIQAATSGDAVATYSAETDTITLTKQSPGSLVLGGGADTSNFLELSKLFSTNSTTATSAATLGAVDADVLITQSNLAALESVSSTGTFIINGQSIAYNLNTDSLQSIISAVETSAAGVSLKYDSINGVFFFENQNTGSLGIQMEDTSGGLLAAMGLLSGTLNLGSDAVFQITTGAPSTISSAPVLMSHSNEMDPGTHGIQGLYINAQSVGTLTFSVSPQVSAVATTLQTFVDAFNTIESTIAEHVKRVKGLDGTYVHSPLAGDRDIEDIARQLRSITFTTSNPNAQTIFNLTDIGINFEKNSNLIAIKNPNKLSNAIQSAPDEVASLLTLLQSSLNTYVTSSLISPRGMLEARLTNIKVRSHEIDRQIDTVERRIDRDAEKMRRQLIAMQMINERMHEQTRFLDQMVAQLDHPRRY